MQGNIHKLTLIDFVVFETGFLKNAVLILGFSMFVAACSQVSIWTGIVPVTGQTLAVLLTGAILGSRRGALTMIAYVVIGVTGIPFWFSFGGPAGMARLIGPTGGYLIGFVAMAFVSGWFAERGWDRKIVLTVISMMAASIVMYVSGLAWLYRFVPEGGLLKVGLYPFIIGDVLKIALAALLLPAGWKIIDYLKK